MMKLTVILIIIGGLQAGAEGLSQTLTLKLRNASLQQAFREIEKQSRYSFVYGKEQLIMAKTVNLYVSDANLETVLNLIFDNQPLTYTISGNYIAVKQKQAVPYSAAVKESPLPIDVTGKITDTEGNPLEGVTVKIKGAQKGALTDAMGNFTIRIPDNSGILVISYVGYESIEVPVSKAGSLTISLKQKESKVEEVIVVGYGTQKKSDVTGAVTRVGEKDIQSRPVANLQDALIGRASGVQVTQTGGDLNGRFSIAIRGAGTVTTSNEPLIVVDGVPLFSGGLSTINPKDIVAIDILKDASAAAIYGARASNGVIIVSTRRGVAGKTTVTVSTDMGLEKIGRTYKVLTSEQQRQLFVEAFKNSSRSTTAYENPNDSIWQVNNNWQKLATRTAFRQNYNFSITGGGPKNRFAVSGGYLKREGTMKNTDITDYFFRANNDMVVNERLKISSAFTGSYQIQHTLPNDVFNSGGIYESLVSAHAYNPAYDANGNLKATNTSADPFFGSNINPLINLLLPERVSKTTRLLGNAKADYEISKGLILSGNFGADIVLGNNYNYTPVYEIGIFRNAQGSTSNANTQAINWVADATIEYQKMAGVHSIKALAGFSSQQYNIISSSATGTGTVDNALNQLSNQTIFSGSGSDISSGLLSSFFRMNYAYDEKYLLTATVRRDGSSKFGPGNRFGVFPSASVAWRVTREKFFNPSLINDLKFRISYGLTGNQNINDFAFITRAGATPYVFGNTVAVGNSPGNLGNPLLQWESAKQLDAGFDISFLQGRITATVDYYDKKSENLLIQVPVPYTAGIAESPTVNIGSVKNTGIEFFVSSKNLTGRLNWSTDFNITHNKNKVINIGSNSIGQPLQLPGSILGLPQDYANLTVSGRPIGSFYMYRFIGIWQSGQHAEAAVAGAVPGDTRYADLNKNGILDEGDKDFVGSPQPLYFGGLNNTVSYGNFSLSIFMNFSGGNKLYNSMRNLNARAVPFNQQLEEVADFWTPQNPSNKIPRPSQGGNSTFLSTRISTRFLEDASFLKLKNLNLSYDMPSALMQKARLQAARITLTGTNVFTWTKYSGLDPESSSQGGLISGGLDFTPYPSIRAYSLSLSVSF